MQNETIGSLFELLKMAAAKCFHCAPFYILIVLLCSIIGFAVAPDPESAEQVPLLLQIFIQLAITVLFYLAGVTIAVSKTNTINYQLDLLATFTLTRSFHLLAALFVQILAIIIGCILFLVPGIYLSIRTYTMPYAAVLQGQWPISAFDISTKDTDGCKWAIFGFSIPLTLIVFLVMIMPAILLAFLPLGESIGILILTILINSYIIVLTTTVTLLHIKHTTRDNA